MESIKNGDVNKEDAGTDEYESNAYFEPVVELPLVERITFEEDENSLVKLRAKLYRFDSSETPSVWKERGTGEIKLLHHPVNHTVRVVMRRDKTLKICANHFIVPSMELIRPKSDKKNWWMWSTTADFADEIFKPEIFAIKFATEEEADTWKEKFTDGQKETEKIVYGDKSDDSATKSIESTSESETEEHYEDASDKSVTTEGLSESVLHLDINKSSS